MRSIKPTSDLPTLLRQSHRQVFRISLALCGSRVTAQTVLESVVRHSKQIFKTWETDQDAQRWFVHHTVLLSRAFKAPAADDLLLSVATDPDSIATMTAIRRLPTQQREAFLLHHGEAMDLRQMATAMDCSSAAAANHLVAAVASLRSVNPHGLGDFTARLPSLLQQLVPTTEGLEQDFNRIVAVENRREKKRRILLWFWRLVALLAAAAVIWFIHQRVEFD